MRQERLFVPLVLIFCRSCQAVLKTVCEHNITSEWLMLNAIRTQLWLHRGKPLTGPFFFLLQPLDYNLEYRHDDVQIKGIFYEECESVIIKFIQRILWVLVQKGLMSQHFGAQTHYTGKWSQRIRVVMHWSLVRLILI